MSSDYLDGWDAISVYIKRDKKTARRWERFEGLPVHRLSHRKGGSVYALRSEIDRWHAERSLRRSSGSQGQNEAHLRDEREYCGLAACLEIPRLTITDRNRFHFCSERIPFEGRRNELDLLNMFLDCPASVSWMLITGSGGAGKSRLALELCHQRSRDWTVGFLRQGDEKLAALVSGPPTLVVVDYAGSRATATQRLILDLNRQAAQVDRRVRVLLLERDAESSWWNEFRGVGLTMHALESLRFSESLVLGRMAEDELWNQVRSISQSLRLPTPDRQRIFEYLHQVDPEGRPLLVHLAAEMYLQDPNTPPPDHLSLLREVLRREEALYWRPAGVTVSDKTVVAIATLSGLPMAISSLLDDPALDGLIPSRAMLDPERLRAITASPATDVIRPIEPDLLGELFVLDHIASLRVDIQGRLIALAHSALLTDSGLGFMTRLVFDYPTHPMSTRLLALDHPSARLLVAFVGANRTASVAHGEDSLRVCGTICEFVQGHADEPDLLYPFGLSLKNCLVTLVDEASAKPLASQRVQSVLVLYNVLSTQLNEATLSRPAASEELAKATTLLVKLLGITSFPEAQMTMFQSAQRQAAAHSENDNVVEYSCRSAAVIIASLTARGGDWLAEVPPIFAWLKDQLISRLTLPAFRRLLGESSVEVVKALVVTDVDPDDETLSYLRSITDQFPSDEHLATCLARAVVNAIAFRQMSSRHKTLVNELRHLHSHWQSVELLTQLIRGINNASLSPALTDADLDHLHSDLLQLTVERGGLSNFPANDLRRAYSSVMKQYLVKRPEGFSTATRRARRKVGALSTAGGRAVRSINQSLTGEVAASTGNRSQAAKCFAEMRLLAEPFPSDTALQEDWLSSGVSLLYLARQEHSWGVFLNLLIELQEILARVPEGSRAREYLAWVTSGVQITPLEEL